MADLADLVNKLARVDGFYGSVHDFFGHEFKPLSNLFDEDECADLVRLFENPTDLGYYAFWNELADYMKHSRALDCLEQALGITVETEDVCAKLEEVGFKSRKGFGLLRMGFAFSTTLLTGLRRYQSQFYSVMKYHKDFYRSVSGLVETLNSLDPSLREDIFEFYSGLGGDFRIKLEAMIEMAKLGKERPLDLGFLMQIAPELKFSNAVSDSKELAESARDFAKVLLKCGYSDEKQYLLYLFNCRDEILVGFDSIGKSIFGAQRAPLFTKCIVDYYKKILPQLEGSGFLNPFIPSLAQKNAKVAIKRFAYICDSFNPYAMGLLAGDFSLEPLHPDVVDALKSEASIKSFMQVMGSVSEYHACRWKWGEHEQKLALIFMGYQPDFHTKKSWARDEDIVLEDYRQEDISFMLHSLLELDVSIDANFFAAFRLASDVKEQLKSMWACLKNPNFVDSISSGWGHEHGSLNGLMISHFAYMCYVYQHSQDLWREMRDLLSLNIDVPLRSNLIKRDALTAYNMITKTGHVKPLVSDFNQIFRVVNRACKRKGDYGLLEYAAGLVKRVVEKPENEPLINDAKLALASWAGQIDALLSLGFDFDSEDVIEAAKTELPINVYRQELHALYEIDPHLGCQSVLDFVNSLDNKFEQPKDPVMMKRILMVHEHMKRRETAKTKVIEHIRAQHDPQRTLYDLIKANRHWYATFESCKLFIEAGYGFDNQDELEKWGKPVMALLRNLETSPAFVIDYGCGHGLKGISVQQSLETPELIFFDGYTHFLDIANCNAIKHMGRTCATVQGDMEDLQGKLKQFDRKLVLFLGQTLGNFSEMGRVMHELRDNMGPNDYLILEVDTKKDMAIYQDPKFQESFLRLIGIDPSDVKHHAVKGSYYEQNGKLKHKRSDSANVYFKLKRALYLDDLFLREGTYLHTGHSQEFKPSHLNKKMEKLGFILQHDQSTGDSYYALYKLKSSTPQAPQQ